ncbi:MAG: two-component system, LuxR family, response regulator FixJ [Sphingomonadales bacterium]|jgi:two-component system response regulator FixJ|nr:two-component system, LuxR family, response regulator FixJ [Sphingomonadales bacterium]
MSHQRTVYVVDNDLETRRSLTINLASIGAEAWPFGSGGEFLEIFGHLMPGCILLDLDAEDRLEVLAALVGRETGWPILAMSAEPRVEVAVQAMKLGALDFLEKPIESAKLAAALIPAWTRLEASLEQSEARRVAQDRLARLTARELDISLALFGGRSNKTVAHELGISVRTVEMHRAHIMAKLGVKSIAEAAVMATHAGLAIAHRRPVASMVAPPAAGRRSAFEERRHVRTAY